MMTRSLGAQVVVAVSVEGMPSRKARFAANLGARAVRRYGRGRCRVFLRSPLPVGTIFLVEPKGVGPTYPTTCPVLRGKEGKKVVYAVDVTLMTEVGRFDVAAAARGEKTAALKMRTVDRNFWFQAVAVTS